MKSYVALAFAATALATPMPQAPTVPDCASSSDQTFQIQTVDKPASKRGLERRQLDGTLTITLKDGILKDQAGRQGYIASNDQFQFDPEPQPNSKQNDGFALCSNGSLALGGNRPYGDSTWWQCLSGDFYNLYSASQGLQCLPIHIQAVNMGSGSGASQAPTPTPVATQIPDGQPQASTPAPKPSAPAASQIPDGQPQASAPAPAPKPSAPVVSQIPDGQPQASTPAPKPSAPVVSQIPDGQPQASAPAAAPKPSAPVVSQIPDGQPQASAPAPAPAPTPVGPVVSQIPDGQPQATKPANSTVGRPTTSAPAQFTGAAAVSNVGMGAFAAGLFGLFALL